MDAVLVTAAIFGLLLCGCSVSGVEGIGVNYGMIGNNLPSPDKVIALYRANNITDIRLFHPDTTVLAALRGSGLGVVLGTLNEDLARLATDASFAASWVQSYVQPFAGAVRFRYINAGNEVIPGDEAASVLPAMRNLQSALRAAGLGVPVTTVVATSVLGSSYPPSQGAFSEAALPTVAPIVSFLASSGTPLLVNAGGQGLEVVVSETGWPSGGGGAGASVENAAAYSNNLVRHVGRGTPRRPGKAVETYIFAMFNENQKPEGVEQNFGLFHPDMSAVYHVDFSA
uniref:Glucan endo-1,3-beta-D-glucosidase n=1 Tax=Oryza barthii TaxID=65489 RepID=A0A0D3EV49_9ORYZ